jgi:hypothetical protein
LGKDKNLKIGNGTEQFHLYLRFFFNELSWVLILFWCASRFALFKGIKNGLCRISLVFYY